MYESKESRFRRILKSRSADVNFKSEPNGQGNRFAVCFEAIQRILKEQMDLPNVELTDNLTDHISDLPDEEILADALELLGIKAKPQYELWDGSVKDLVRILEENVLMHCKT